MTSTVNDQDAEQGDDPTERLEALEEQLQDYRVSRDAWTFVIFGIAILTAIASVVAIGLALRGDDDDDAAAGRAPSSRSRRRSASSPSRCRPARSASAAASR